MKFIIIQNTSYHFEVTISLYSTIKRMGYEVALYICETILSENKYLQKEFIKLNNIETINLDTIDPKESVGIVVSSYPYCNRDIMPNPNDKIFDLLDANKLFFLRHRLKKQNENNKIKNITIANYNSIYLTPLAGSIKIDYIWLTDCPIIPEHHIDSNNIRLTVQGDFNFDHRDYSVLKELIDNSKHTWQIIGNKSEVFIQNYLSTVDGLIVQENMSEIEFYNVLNKQTDFIVPCIDGSTRNGDYVQERYSTSFLYACVLEKPIFAHEVFEKVYNIPGVYYNSTNIVDKFQQLLSLKEKEYSELIIKFSTVKKEMLKHNQYIIQNIIYKCSNNQ